jgi:hypothetical protein
MMGVFIIWLVILEEEKEVIVVVVLKEQVWILVEEN